MSSTAVERKPVKSVAGATDSIVEILRRLGLARTKEAQALGLDKGTYQQTAHAQLEALMQPHQEEHVRFYAWMLRGSFGWALEPHSTNKKLGSLRYHGRCVMKQLERGRKIPATQADACRDLKMWPQQVSRALVRCEELKLARRRIVKDGQVLLFCYARPQRARRWEPPTSQVERPGVNRPENAFPVSDTITITYRPDNCKWKIKLDLPGIIRPERRADIEAALAKWASIIRPEIEKFIGPESPYKEERKVKRNENSKEQCSIEQYFTPEEESSSAVRKGTGNWQSKGQKNDDDPLAQKARTQNQPPSAVEENPQKHIRPSPKNPSVETEPSQNPVSEANAAIAATAPDGTEMRWDLDQVRCALHNLATQPGLFAQPRREAFPLPDLKITAEILQPWRGGGREIGFFDWLLYAAERRLGEKRKGPGYALFLSDSIACANQWTPDRWLSEKLRFRSNLASWQNRQAKEPEPACERCKGTGMVGSEFCSCERGRDEARRTEALREQRAQTARIIERKLSHPHTINEHRQLICDYLSAEHPIPDPPCSLCSDAKAPLAAAAASAAGGSGA